jgi:hypothetical protein
VPTFQLFDTTLSETTPDVFGVWETKPTLDESAVSFGVPGEEAGEDVAVWSVNLSPDLELSNRQMDAGLAQVATSKQGLLAAQQKINNLVAHKRAENDISFSASEAPPLPPLSVADEELMRMLGRFKEARDEEVSFGFLDNLVKKVQNIVPDDQEEKFRAAMERLTAGLVYYAAVETRINNALLARTQISWTADSKTIWQGGAEAGQYALHTKTLNLAIESRNALMRTFGLTAQAAVKLTTLFALPGGAVLALPTAWKYINEIVAEVGKYQSLRQQQVSG